MGILDAPGISPVAARRAVNRGAGLTLLTDAQRSAYTPAVDEIAYATDTYAFYTGDGSTLGGVSSALGLSAAQLVRLRFIQARHSRFLSRWDDRVAGFKGAGYGNSIVQGTGSTSASTTWLFRLGVKLAAGSAALDTNSNFAPSNNGVGGSMVYTPLSYAADRVTSAGNLTVSTARGTDRPYALLMSMRNEAAAPLSAVTAWPQLLRVTLRQLKRTHGDVLMVTDPPLINITTGVVLDSTTWANLAAVTSRVCADEGVTLVDFWSYAMWLYAQGVDLRPFSYDGTHPNDAGHDLIAALVYQALFTPREASADAGTTGSLREASLAVAAAVYDASVAPASVATVSSFATTSTARKNETGEGTTSAYSVTSAQTITFHCPLPAYRVIVQYVQGGSATGTATFNGVSAGSLTSSSTATVIELASASTVATPAPGKLVITGAANTLKILGVTFITADPVDQHDTWPGATEVGSWSSATFGGAGMATSGAARVSSTVGNTLTVAWYGTRLTYALESGTGFGKISEATDGGATTTTDCYSTTSEQTFVATPVVTEGWHSTVFTIVTKNASSSANAVRVGLLKSYLPPSSKVAFVSVGSGEVMPLPGKWRSAALVETISGTPVLRWTPYASTITLTGGAAIVRLER